MGLRDSARRSLGIACNSAGAFTLVEAVFSMIIVAVMLVAALNAAGAASRTDASAADSQLGAALAESLAAEIRSRAYRGAEDTAGIAGRSAAEIATGNRSLFDDVNDYAAWSESPPKTLAGAVLPGTTGWTRSVEVAFVAPSDFATGSLTDQGIARIRVTASRSGRDWGEVTLIRTSALPARQACCMANGSCAMMITSDCTASGGTAVGAGSNCLNSTCGGDLIAYWKFNEGSGQQAYDESARHPAVISGASWITGQEGKALSMDGDDVAVAAHAAELSLTRDFTLMAYIYLPDTTGVRTLISKGSTAKNYWFYQNGSGLGLGFDNDSLRTYVSDTITIKKNTWTHVAVTFEAASLTVAFFADGKLYDRRTAAAIPLANSDPLYLGREPAGTGLLGRLDQVMIFRKALSESEISSVMGDSGEVIIDLLKGTVGGAGSLLGR